MNTFENDLSLYDEFDVATEGLKEVATKVGKTIGNAAKAVFDVIKSFGEWLSKQLHKLLEWGKALKRNKLVDPEADQKAETLSKEISNEIFILSGEMYSLLEDIAKEKSNETNNEKSSAVGEIYGKMNKLVGQSGEIAIKLKQLPRMKMSYSVCGAIYNRMKGISDNNSKMYTIVGRINTGIESGALDSKQKALTKFVNLYQKLRKCTEALLARFNGMSIDFSSTSQQIKNINEYNKNVGEKSKKISPIDDVDSDNIKNTISISNPDINEKIREKLSNPKITKLNNGEPVNTIQWIKYVTNKIEKDAKDNPNDNKKQLIAERMKDKHNMLLYVLSVTNAANVKKWLNSSANESVSSDSDDLDFTDIIYENIRESVLEDAYLEAEEAADMAFEGLETEEDMIATESAWEEVSQLSVKKMIDSGMKKDDAIKSMDNFIKYMDTHKMMDKHYDEFTIDENTVVTKKDLNSKGIQFIKYCLKKIKEIPNNPENVEKLHSALQEYTKDKTKIIKVAGIISGILGIGTGIILPLVGYKTLVLALFETLVAVNSGAVIAGSGFGLAMTAKKNINKAYNM
mgnify:CR=1 FL=1